MIHTKGDLAQMQSLPLSAKILMTKRRIREWYDYWDGQVYISFSGGKDSTVLLHIARELYPDIEAVFVNTGLEYPEIQSFVKTFDNVTILRPKMRFDEVIKKYGYPIISKGVSRKIDGARKGQEWAKKYVDGTAKKKDGKKSFYTVEKYSPLVNADFLVSNQCCDIMKKLLQNIIQNKAVKNLSRRKWQMKANKGLHNGCKRVAMLLKQKIL